MMPLDRRKRILTTGRCERPVCKSDECSFPYRRRRLTALGVDRKFYSVDIARMGADAETLWDDRLVSPWDDRLVSPRIQLNVSAMVRAD